MLYAGPTLGASARLDFYAAVATAGGNGREALKYIGSVNGATAGEEDFDADLDDED